MRKFLSRAVLFALTATLLAGCGQVNAFKAKVQFRDANELYQKKDYEKAAAAYEQVLALAPDDPRFSTAYFFLGNSYDQMYRATEKGDPKNDAYLTKAIENYKKSAEREQDPTWKLRASQYLVSVYTDKLQDPSAAVPVLQNLIQMNPTDPGNYNVLAKIYEDSGEYDLAEQTLLKARDMKPNDSSVYMQLAGFYQRQGEFDKQMAAVKARADKEPNNPEAFYTVATYYWDQAYHNKKLSDAQKLEYVQDGLTAVNKALEIRNDYPEALNYKGLLLRVQALIEKNPKQQQALLHEAEQLSAKAQEIRSRQKGT